MKVSSSFILAQKGDFSEKQKEVILQYAVKKLLGNSWLIPESTEEEIRVEFKACRIDDKHQKQIRQALSEGKSIRFGFAFLDCGKDSCVEMFTGLWNVLKETDPNAFAIIDDDLDR